MRLFIIYLNTSVWFGHANLKKSTLSDEAKNMGDNQQIKVTKEGLFSTFRVKGLMLWHRVLSGSSHMWGY